MIRVKLSFQFFYHIQNLNHLKYNIEYYLTIFKLYFFSKYLKINDYLFYLFIFIFTYIFYYNNIILQNIFT